MNDALWNVGACVNVITVTNQRPVLALLHSASDYRDVAGIVLIIIPSHSFNFVSILIPFPIPVDNQDIVYT